MAVPVRGAGPPSPTRTAADRRDLMRGWQPTAHHPELRQLRVGATFAKGSRRSPLPSSPLKGLPARISFEPFLPSGESSTPGLAPRAHQGGSRGLPRFHPSGATCSRSSAPRPLWGPPSGLGILGCCHTRGSGGQVPGPPPLSSWDGGSCTDSYLNRRQPVKQIRGTQPRDQTYLD